MPPRYRDSDWLHRRYHDDGRTQHEIADECDVSPRTIRKWMNRHDIDTRDVEGEHHGLYGKTRSEETKQKISETMQGREFSAETRRKISQANRDRTVSPSSREKVSESLSGRTLSEETRRKMSEGTAGEKNPNWRGGYSGSYGPGWTLARERVIERDEICQHCGEDGTNRELDVHHIVPVRAYRENPDVSLADAHAVDNLVLLCKRCHALVEHGGIPVPDSHTA